MPFDFNPWSYSPYPPQKSNLEVMMENFMMNKNKDIEEIKLGQRKDLEVLKAKVERIVKMLEQYIAQQASHYLGNPIAYSANRYSTRKNVPSWLA